MVTSRDLPLANEAVTLFDGDIDGLSTQLKRESDHVWLVGGGRLARTLLDLDQIDELRLSYIPVLLGDGIPLFGDGAKTQALEPTDTKLHPNGIIEAQYRM